MSIYRLCLITIAVTILAAGASVQAAQMSFTAKLTGANHVPEPVTTPATGEVKLTVAADGRRVDYVVSVKDLANAASADLHLGPAGANGPLVVKLFPVGGAKAKKGPFTGVLAQGSFGAADLIGPMTGAGLDDLLEQIRSGNSYVNVHSNDGVDPPNSGPGDYRLGEIRGQIE